MAYPGYPATYTPMYYSPAPAQPQPQPAQGGIIWIQGEMAAKSYLVAPNTTVQLWDSERQTIYLKSADAAGMPSMKVLDYTIRDTAQPAPAAPATQYATHAEVDALAGQLESLRADLDAIAAHRAARGKEENA